MVAILAALVFAVAAAACTTTPQAPAALALGSAIGDADSMLALALAAASAVPDLSSRVFVYTRIAESYRVNGLADRARSVLDESTALINRAASPERVPEILTEISKFYARLGDTERTLSLLHEAVRLVAERTDERFRGQVIAEVISVCFDLGIVAGEVLRAAVQTIYIFEDYENRAELLTETARKYQGSGLNQPVGNLLQQAVAGAANIENPFARAQAYVEIAARFRSIGREQNSAQYADRALTVLRNASFAAISDTDVRRMVPLTRNLVELGRSADALSVIRSIREVTVYVETMLMAIDAVAAAGDPLELDFLLREFFRTLQDDWQVPGDAVADAAIGVARIYDRLGDSATAAAYIDFAQTQIDSPTTRDSSIALLADYLLAADQIDAARRHAERIADAGERTTFFVRQAEVLADRLRESGESPPWPEIDLLVDDALASVGDAQFLTGGLYAAIGILMVRNADPSAGFALFEQIEDPYTLSLALAEASLHHGFAQLPLVGDYPPLMRLFGRFGREFATDAR